MDHMIFNVRTWLFLSVRVVYTRGVGQTDRESAQHLWLGKTLTILSCAPGFEPPIFGSGISNSHGSAAKLQEKCLRLQHGQHSMNKQSRNSVWRHDAGWLDFALLQLPTVHQSKHCKHSVGMEIRLLDFRSPRCCKSCTAEPEKEERSTEVTKSALLRLWLWQLLWCITFFLAK